MSFTPDLPAHDAPVPPGLPDPATLAQMASAFLRALPGGAPATGGVSIPVHPEPPGLSLPPGVNGPATPAAVPAGALPPGANLVPSQPQSVANAGASTPALVPHAQAPNGVPDLVLTSAPGYDGRLGQAALGMPSAPTRQTAPSTAPFYFLDPAVGQGADVVSTPDLQGPLSTEALRQLLSDTHRPAHAPTGSGPAPFYFIDSQDSATAGLAKAPPTARPLDVHGVRRDFPILSERINGRPLVWFDNAATTHKPQAVIDRLAYFYAHENSNIHRAAHSLAARATDAYEDARETVRRFIGARGTDEIIFVRGTTEGIHLVAKSWGTQNIGPGDEIVVSHLEHHANIVPWQQLAADKGAKLRVIPVDDTGQIQLDAYRALLNERTKIVAVTQVSNALGTIVPVQEVVALARALGITTLVDGAQSISHLPVNMQSLGADFFVFSGHKIFGPTGIDAVYGRREILDDMPPWQGAAT